MILQLRHQVAQLDRAAHASEDAISIEVELTSLADYYGRHSIAKGDDRFIEGA